MIKRLVAWSVVIIIAVGLFVLKGMVPEFYYNAGVDAFKAKNYAEALHNFNYALKFDKSNKNYRYYYVQTLLSLPATLEVQKDLFEFSQINQPDSADLIADRKISEWRQNIMRNSGENFIEQVPYDSRILRWDVDKFPLKVKIDNQSGAPDYFANEIRKAFNEWTGVGGFLKFAYSDENPDIVISIVSSKNNKCDKEDCKYVVGFTTPTIKGNILKTMTINFYDKNNLGQYFSQMEIFNTALHEIGHALGIMGHSYNKDDLMFMTASNMNDFVKRESDFLSITPHDRNTLKLLYKLIPDISNSSDIDTKGLIYAPIVLGSVDKINSTRLLEAQNYIQQAPNIPNGYVDLASAYADQKDYNSSIDALNKALTLTNEDSAKFMIYYNLAVVYMNIQEWDKAIEYANIAKTSNPSADIDGLIAAINFNRGNKNFAKTAYEDALKNNPASIRDSVNLATIYLREFNFIKAGHTLNTLVKNNPEAKNDKRVKSYGLLMWLFR